MNRLRRMPSGKVVCSRTGKVAFPDEESAKKRLEELSASSHLKRAYRCPSCKTWHLTSEAVRQNRPKRTRQREKLNDGNLPARRVSKDEDTRDSRLKMEGLWAAQLGYHVRSNEENMHG